MLTKTAANLAAEAAIVARKFSAEFDRLAAADRDRIDPTRISQKIKDISNSLMGLAEAMDREIANPTSAPTTLSPHANGTSDTTQTGQPFRSSASELHSELADGLRKAHGIFGG